MTDPSGSTSYRYERRDLQEGDFTYHSNQAYADSEGYRGSATLLAVTTLPERFEQGESGRGTITLNAPAPKGGVIVSLSASRPGVQLPATVLVQEGAVTASFELATEAEALPGDLTITASQDAIRRTRAITILPKDGHQPRKQSPWNRLNLHQPEAAPLSLGIRGAFFDLRPRTNTIAPPHKYYLYTPELSLMAETTASTSTTPSVAYEYVWFNGKPVAQVDVATSTIHSVFTDHLGTPIAETDATGAIDWRAEYEPFGTVTTYRTGATRHQPLRFPGQEYDAADGSGEREYNIFRWYRSGWARYTQGDPMGLKGGHLFAYALGRPTSLTDPLGLKVKRCFRPLNTPGNLGTALYLTAVVLSGPVQLPIPGNALCVMHEFLLDDQTGTTIGFGPNGPESESPDAVSHAMCTGVVEPDDVGQCAMKQMQYFIEGYLFLGNSCHSAINAAVTACSSCHTKPRYFTNDPGMGPK